MRVRKEHALGKQEASNRVGAIADSLCSSYGLTSSWVDNELHFDGSGVKGCIHVEEHFVEVTVKLGFALSMMAGTIRQSLEEAMDQHLA
jgi:putative polyhydroxyalkanoate system protein